MLTRREVLSTGVAVAGGGATTAAAQPSREGDPRLADVVDRLGGIMEELRYANRGTFTGEFAVGVKLRDAMVPFLRAQQKYPDFIDVGYDVFHQVYDWHVHNRLGINLDRSADGRYGLVYLFTRLILRPDTVPEFIGVPYDLRP